ncbi:hypothetical protein [Azospirillum sp. SYSU D00513]|uniref:hypothetical protein n=1 Tax=Azospirillum sp. SYSU D00513 TaxID=2812561 RepID=UPI001A95B135|nr:hypothetical protein [Azospirillum sp. SYSU D00513]
MQPRLRFVPRNTGGQDTGAGKPARQESEQEPVRLLTEVQIRVLAFIMDRSLGWATPIRMVEDSPLLETGDAAAIPSLIEDGLIERAEDPQAVRLTGAGHTTLAAQKSRGLNGQADR